MYRAAAALAHCDPGPAASRLRGQLTTMACAASATPDWSTLVVDGPTSTFEHGGETWFEWTGTVQCGGGLDLASVGDPVTPLGARTPEDTAALAGPALG